MNGSSLMQALSMVRNPNQADVASIPPLNAGSPGDSQAVGNLYDAMIAQATALAGLPVDLAQMATQARVGAHGGTQAGAWPMSSDWLAQKAGANTESIPYLPSAMIPAGPGGKAKGAKKATQAALDAQKGAGKVGQMPDDDLLELYNRDAMARNRRAWESDSASDLDFDSWLAQSADADPVAMSLTDISYNNPPGAASVIEAALKNRGLNARVADVSGNTGSYYVDVDHDADDFGDLSARIRVADHGNKRSGSADFDFSPDGIDNIEDLIARVLDRFKSLNK